MSALIDLIQRTRASFCHWAGALFCFGFSVILLALFTGECRLWSSSGPILWASAPWGMSIGAGLMILSLILRLPHSIEDLLSMSGFSAALLLLLLSDWINNSYSLLPGPLIRGEIITLTFLAWLLLRLKNPNLIIPSASLVALCLLLGNFLFFAEGRLLYNDDNSTFIYRLELLKENFPFIPFYHPLWNAGIEARDFFATGALNAYFLFLPIIELFRIRDVYTMISGLMLFALLPASLFLASRLEGGSRRAAAFSALLAVGSSLLWYRWAMKYGTLGFSITTALVPLNLVLARHLISGGKQISRGLAIMSVASFTLMLFWSPSALIFIPAVFYALLSLPRLINNRRFILVAVLIAILNIPWMLMFYSVSNVGSFLKSEAPSTHTIEMEDTAQGRKPEVKVYKHKKKPFTVEAALKSVRENTTSANPILFVFVIPGLLLLSKSSRFYYASALLWLVALGLYVPHLKPQLEFDRMLIVALLLAALPAGFALEKLTENSSGGRSLKIWAALLLGTLTASLFSVSAIIRNRSHEQYSFSRPILNNIVEAIKQHGGEGRVLFSGFVLHELNNGHLAPLSVWTGKPLIASSQVHDQWRYKQVIPDEFITHGDEGIRDYLNLMNVSAIFTHERLWRDYFRARPAEYREVWQEERFRLFERIGYQSDWLIEGQEDNLRQDTNSISFTAQSSEALLKFRYYPFLESSSCRISPHRVSEEMEFIRIEGCRPGQEVKIKAIGPLKRLSGITTDLHDQVLK